MYASFDALPDEGLPQFAHGVIESGALTPHVRNAVQDVLWADLPEISLTKRQRRLLCEGAAPAALALHDYFY